MERIRNEIKKHHIISVLAVAGIAFAAMNFSNPPLFNSLDAFVLFGAEGVTIEQETQASSGDIGSNKEINIEKDSIINGNLFADRITIDKNTTINGNVSFNKLKLHKEAQILGTQTKPVQLPIVVLPEIANFSIGTQNFKFEGENNTLTAGNYRDITIEKNSRLVLSGGVYNLRKLELKENSTLIFSSPTILNIQFKFRGHKKVSILPGQNLKPIDLIINYRGLKPKHEKNSKEDDDDEINSLHDDKEKKDSQHRKLGRPVVFGKNSFLNFGLLAPRAKVHVEKESTLRGQVLARKVKIEKDSVLSREVSGIKEFDPIKVIIDSEKSIYSVNEVIVNFTIDATALDAKSVAERVNGMIVGHIGFANAYQILVPASTEAELDSIIERIKSLNNLKVEGVFPNFIHSIENL